jgi:hypothetical protein
MADLAITETIVRPGYKLLWTLRVEADPSKPRSFLWKLYDPRRNDRPTFTGRASSVTKAREEASYVLANNGARPPRPVKPRPVIRFTVEHRGATYQTTARIKVGDLVVATFGREWPQTIVSRVTALESDYDGSCRQPIAIIRGGRVLT